MHPLLDSSRKPLVGMVHLPALPGAPGYGGTMRDIAERALRDAAALAKAGFDALMLENFGDAPFTPDAVGAETVAAMAVVAARIRAEIELPLGINVLRNDAAAAIGIAAAVGGSFIRVNVHTGALLTDQGWIQGRAHETVRLKQRLAPELLICADVLVKHATPLPGTELEAVAQDTYQRGRADVLIVTGKATGASADPGRIRAVKTAVPDAPVWIGSGLSAERAPALLAAADGAIVGSAIKVGGNALNPVDPAAARRLVQAARTL